ncbi:hypothetical protein, variant 2 [Phytophthora nicotianae CJ01A1]|uniref:Uncharacterized protein n=1 Tax=Phytophthora nicotianae CJ01A1 TaxID=1317063 RepID=W2W2K0_PHYNI|nr:hypothetical protein, variant 2 [Phytophthora nicotianae CJ01A1]
MLMRIECRLEKPDNASSAHSTYVILVECALDAICDIQVKYSDTYAESLILYQEEEKPVFERQTYYTRPLWLIGLVLVVLGAVGDFEALGFAPQALVASVGGGFTVLANVFFAHLWLGQILTKTDVLGTLLIIIGVVLSTVANEPDEQMSLVELEKQFFQLGFLIYLGVMTVVLGGIFGQIEAILRLPRALNENKYRLLPFMYATASGIFGSFSVLLAKCASILLILTFSGENQFVYFTTYLFMGGMMCTLVLQTDLLNRAIMAGDTLSVFPMFQCFWIGRHWRRGILREVHALLPLRLALSANCAGLHHYGHLSLGKARGRRK